jgi:hypothetical protein
LSVKLHGGKHAGSGLTRAGIGRRVRPLSLEPALDSAFSYSF